MKAKPAYYKETIHSQLRRALWHNYYDRAVYMVTICKSPACPDFGHLNFRTIDGAFIELSSLGLIIREQIEATPLYNPELKMIYWVIMPDHLHILINVTMPIERHFGDIIQAIKAACTSRIRKLLQKPDLMVFSEGFHDRIITNRHQFEIVYRYLRENPRRLAVRRANPGYFRRINSLQIGDKSYRAYGNFQLLECPFKEQVIVHRADTPDIRRRNRDLWLYTAANRGVLVSPFISPAEKAIRAEAEDVGGRIILIIPDAIGERYKPSGSDFALCEEGRMLIVAVPPTESKTLTRAHCMTMNGVAESIAARG